MLETAWESRWMPDSLWGCSSVGRAPALQAGGQEFESLRLHWMETSKEKNPYLENRILKIILKYLIDET